MELGYFLAGAVLVAFAVFAYSRYRKSKDRPPPYNDRPPSPPRPEPDEHLR